MRRVGKDYKPGLEFEPLPQGLVLVFRYIHRQLCQGSQISSIHPLEFDEGVLMTRTRQSTVTSQLSFGYGGESHEEDGKRRGRRMKRGTRFDGLYKYPSRHHGSAEQE